MDFGCLKALLQISPLKMNLGWKFLLFRKNYLECLGSFDDCTVPICHSCCEYVLIEKLCTKETDHKFIKYNI